MLLQIRLNEAKKKQQQQQPILRHLCAQGNVQSPFFQRMRIPKATTEWREGNYKYNDDGKKKQACDKCACVREKWESKRRIITKWQKGNALGFKR